ncbi:MAG: type II CAAX prenyl endopeptidase Rce1 family protein [Candidatus Hodarchaeota archaeon]
MEFTEDTWKNIFLTLDFIIGTIFLLIIFLMFISEGLTLPLAQFIFGLLFVFILGGFFMYIFTPSLIEFVRNLLSGVIRRLIPLISVLSIFTIYRIVVPTSTDLFLVLIQIIFAFVFVLTPSILYIIFPLSREDGLSLVDVFSGLWVWLPIEFGVVDDFIGSVEIGGLPFDTLLALFAFLYALIFIRNHNMGLTFTLSLDDFILVGKINGFLVIIILPLGILTSFLATPDIIWSNFMQILEGSPGSIFDVVITFVSIFLGIALIEEIFFRGFIYKMTEMKFEKEEISEAWWYGGVLALMILITLTPWIDDILLTLSQWFSILTPLFDIVGSLAAPLGTEEGQAWPLVQSVPLEVLYLLVAILLGIIAVILIYKTHDPVIAALVLSSILFGWAHFEDLRYIFFASVAGFGYGWTYRKTGKVVPAALVHMTVDAVWSLLFTF